MIDLQHFGVGRQWEMAASHGDLMTNWLLVRDIVQTKGTQAQGKRGNKSHTLSRYSGKQNWHK